MSEFWLHDEGLETSRYEFHRDVCLSQQINGQCNLECRTSQKKRDSSAQTHSNPQFITPGKVKYYTTALSSTFQVYIQNAKKEPSKVAPVQTSDFWVPSLVPGPTKRRS